MWPLVPGENADVALRQADAALYRAKRGRPAPLSTIRPGRAEDRFPGARSAARDTPDMLSPLRLFPCRSPWQPRSWLLPPSPIRHRVVVPAGCGPQRLPGSLKTTVKTFGEPKGRHP